MAYTSRGTSLHGALVAISWFSAVGALLFLLLFEGRRTQFSGTQGWAVLPLLSFGLLASGPFLWLALVRRRVQDWVVFAVYLAATITVLIALTNVPSNTSITGYPAAIWSLLLVIAPAHAVLALSRKAKVPSWREAYPRGTPVTPEQFHDDSVSLQDRPPDGKLDHL